MPNYSVYEHRMGFFGLITCIDTFLFLPLPYGYDEYG
jgi:hypothetical protein